MSLIKKFKDVDWQGWADKPEEETFNNWLLKRIAKKKGNYPSQRAMNMIRTHINKLFNDYSIPADDAFYAAEDKAWDSIKVEWVLRYQSQEMDGYGFSTPVVPIRQTRQIGLHEELTHRSWAIGVKQ